MTFSGYDIIIEAGQSNAEGSGRGAVKEEYIPSEDILYLVQDFSLTEGIRNGVWNIELILTDTPPRVEIADIRRDEKGEIGDLALSFAAEYKRRGLLAEGRKLLIVRAGVGGTGFKKKQWGLSDVVYQRMLALIDHALALEGENNIVAFLWHQGEHDAFEGNTPDVFEGQLKALFTDVKQRYSVPEIPIVAGDFVREWKGENIGICAPIIEKIKKVVSEEGGEFVEASDLPSNNEMLSNGDNIHFCRESLRILGVRYFEAFLKIVTRKKF